MTALAADHAERVWECTHLGGHRFSANLVCLPDGLVYGRVTAAAGPRLVDEFLGGRVDPAFLRGRSPWPPPAQVAERSLRLSLGANGHDDLSLVSIDVDVDRASVVLAAPDGATHRIDLAAERLGPPRHTSCRGDEVEEPLHWRVVGTA